MEKIYLLSFALLCMLLPGRAQDSCSSDLKLYWSFNEDSDSLTDKINNAVIIADSTIQSVTGIVDSALLFDGATNASYSSDSLFDWDSNSTFTIEFWMKKTISCISQNTPDNNVIIGRDDPGTDLHWWIGVSCNYPGKITFVQHANNGDQLELVSNKSVIDSFWHHIIIERDGSTSTTSIYIDGQLDTSAVHAFNDGFKSTVPVNLGWLNLDGKFHYNGMLDELAVYNTLLTDSVINLHYNSGEGMSYCEKEDQTPTPVTDGKPDETGSVVSIYPTFVTSELNIDLRIDEPQNVTITAFDMSGRKISDLFNSWLSEGDHTLNFTSLHQLLKLPDHSFVLIQLKLKNKTLTHKVILAE